MNNLTTCDCPLSQTANKASKNQNFGFLVDKLERQVQAKLTNKIRYRATDMTFNQTLP